MLHVKIKRQLNALLKKGRKLSSDVNISCRLWSWTISLAKNEDRNALSDENWSLTSVPIPWCDGDKLLTCFSLECRIARFFLVKIVILLVDVWSAIFCAGNKKGREINFCRKSYFDCVVCYSRHVSLRNKHGMSQWNPFDLFEFFFGRNKKHGTGMTHLLNKAILWTSSFKISVIL